MNPDERRTDPDDVQRLDASSVDAGHLDAAMARHRANAGTVSFDAGFADRVLARLERSSGDVVGEISPTIALERVFFKLAPLAAAAALLIATMNVISTRTSGQPLVDRVLGLKSVTLASAYTLDSELAGDGILTQGTVTR
jgi:hypothetical protein